MRTHFKILPFIILLLVLCSACQSQGASIDDVKINGNQITGFDLQNSSDRAEEETLQHVIQEQTEKYRRHFLEGRYWDKDLKKYQHLLQEQYNIRLQEEINQIYRKEKKKPTLMSVFTLKNESGIGADKTPFPMILRTNIEFNNQTVERYKNKQITLEEIIQAPGKHIMSANIKLYGFINPNAYIPPDDNRFVNCYNMEEAEKYAFPKEYIMLNQLCQSYVDAGVEYVNLHFKQYDKAILESKNLDHIRAQPDIDLFLKDHWQQIVLYGTFHEKHYYNYRHIKYVQYGEWNRRETLYPIPEGFDQLKIFDEDRKKAITDLKAKYNKEFYYVGGDYYAPVDNPSLYFEEDGYITGNVNPNTGHRDQYMYDHYTSVYLQYLLTQKVNKFIKEEGYQGKMVCFIYAAPDNSAGTEHDTSQLPYDFGNSFEKEEFLKSYTGDINLTLVYLKEKAEQINYQRLRELITKVQQWPFQNILERIVIRKYPNKDLKNEKRSSFNTIFLTIYETDKEVIPIVADLFQRDSVTIHKGKADGLLSEVFADHYVMKVGTQGFHLLDIFAKKEIVCRYPFYDEEYSRIYPKKTMEEFFENENQY